MANIAGAHGLGIAVLQDTHNELDFKCNQHEHANNFSLSFYIELIALNKIVDLICVTGVLAG